MRRHVLVAMKTWPVRDAMSAGHFTSIERPVKPETP